MSIRNLFNPLDKNFQSVPAGALTPAYLNLKQNDYPNLTNRGFGVYDSGVVNPLAQLPPPKYSLGYGVDAQDEATITYRNALSIPGEEIVDKPFITALMFLRDQENQMLYQNALKYKFAPILRNGPSWMRALNRNTVPISFPSIGGAQTLGNTYRYHDLLDILPQQNTLERSPIASELTNRSGTQHAISIYDAYKLTFLGKSPKHPLFEGRDPTQLFHMRPDLRQLKMTSQMRGGGIRGGGILDGLGSIFKAGKDLLTSDAAKQIAKPILTTLGTTAGVAAASQIKPLYDKIKNSLSKAPKGTTTVVNNEVNKVYQQGLQELEKQLGPEAKAIMDTITKQILQEQQAETPAQPITTPTVSQQRQPTSQLSSLGGIIKPKHKRRVKRHGTKLTLIAPRLTRTVRGRSDF